MREKLHDVEFGNDLLDMTPKAEATKEKKISETFKLHISAQQKKQSI